MQTSTRVRRIVRAAIAGTVALGTSAVLFWAPTAATLGHTLG
jgi:hypothetical protein